MREERKLRARSAFKLEEINNKQNFLQPSSLIVDLGDAPGGWSQIAAEKTVKNSKIFNFDSRIPLQKSSNIIPHLNNQILNHGYLRTNLHSQ